MKHFYAREGDILLYSKAKNDIDRLIQYGEERMRHNKQQGEPIAYHVAIALDAFHKIEAVPSGVQIDTIDYSACSVFRPPYEAAKLYQAVKWVRKQRGKLYGWVGDIDQGLRDLTFGRLHLPDSFVRWANKRWPYCSALTADFMVRAGYNEKVPKQYMIPKWPPLDPEAILLLVKGWPVKP